MNKCLLSELKCTERWALGGDENFELDKNNFPPTMEAFHNYSRTWITRIRITQIPRSLEMFFVSPQSSSYRGCTV